jgi:signal transduction histidine kinase
MRWKPRLRTVLLAINIVILLLPLGGIGALRLYESELVRRTESELISQGTLIGAAYREELLRLLAPAGPGGSAPPPSLPYGRQATALRHRPAGDPGQKYHPVIPKLDIAAETIRPSAPAPAVPARAPDPLAIKAGERITPLLLSGKDVTLVGVRLLDMNGTVIASTGGEVGLSLGNREEVRQALTGEYASILRQRVSDTSNPDAASISRGKLLRVFVAMPVLHEGQVLGAVVLSRTPLDIRKALYLVRGQIAVAAAALLGGVLVITLLTSVTVSRPLKALVSQAERVAHGEKVGPLPPDTSAIREIGQLSRAVSTMATTLEERSDYIRTFAANVSHEFKTPLTSIRGTVELLSDHLPEMSAEKRSRFLAIISSDTERLERLVRRLLDLARADSLAPGGERTDGADVLRDVAGRYQAEGMTVSVACPGDPVPLRMAREDFESIVSNMIENARQHGGSGVRVELCGRTDGNVFQLDIRDNGPGISAGNRDRVFRPFFTTARDTGGSGLGLSIVQSLLTAHGGSITLEPSDSGALFRIRVPL